MLFSLRSPSLRGLAKDEARLPLRSLAVWPKRGNSVRPLILLNKHLMIMTGFASGNIVGLGETKLTVSSYTYTVSCYTSQLKTRKKLRRNRLRYASWLINLPQFEGARPHHVQVESSCCCFPRELASFVRLIWPTARDTFSSNRKTYLSCEIKQNCFFLEKTIRKSRSIAYNSTWLQYRFLSSEIILKPQGGSKNIYDWVKYYISVGNTKNS